MRAQITEHYELKVIIYRECKMSKGCGYEAVTSHEEEYDGHSHEEEYDGHSPRRKV